MAVSVVRKLERCERLGRVRQGEAMLNGENYQVIKYKVKIKDYFTTNQVKLDRVTKGSLNYVAPPNDEIKSENLPAWRLQNLQAQTSCQGSSACKGSSSPPPCNIKLRPGSQQNLHAQEDDMQLKSLRNYEEHESIWQDNVLHEHVCSKKSWSHKLHPKPLKLQETSNEQEEEIKLMLKSSLNLQETVQEREDGPSSPRKLEKEVQEKAGGGPGEGVKKMECECCGMEEECTGGYEEKVRAGLKGHWLCGLCEQAVGEERKRVGGNVQAALAAHMQPCRRFSRRARSKACPSPSDVAVPHAVCRLLCRHLSTPSPRRHSSASSCPPSLCRSSSCLPSLPT